VTELKRIRGTVGWLPPLCFFFVAGCALTPPEEDPLYIRVSEVDARLATVERVINNEGLMNLLSQIEQAQRELQSLRNDVETLQNQSVQGDTRQKEQYQDLDRRLQGIEGSLASARASAEARSVLDGGALKPGELPVPGGTDRANYQAAFELLKQGRYKEASAALRQFRVAFPDSSLSDNAQYWLAETQYVSQAYDKALPEFQVVVDKFPESRKVPDALLKIGYSNYELKRFDAARTALKTVATNYPETTAARLANERLERMKTEGV
jgi:tol-pal system protein YbgF